jgi:hypothetical protein
MADDESRWIGRFVWGLPPQPIGIDHGVIGINEEQNYGKPLPSLPSGLEHQTKATQGVTTES